MENVDITGKVKNFIRFGLIGLLAVSGVIGYGMFQHYHADKILQIDNAKVTSNIISVHALTNGKIKELMFEDGGEVKAGDVIAKVEVSITEEDIKNLEKAVATAKQNYESLKQGQRVKTPVRRTKTVPAPTTTTQPATNTRSTASVATLESRVKRLEELYEMGAVSKDELDKARGDLAKARVPAATPAAPAPSTTQTVEIDFVESVQATPAAILESAENAVKQAEMALNAAVEQSQQTEIVAPVDGVVYYNFVVDEEIKADDVVAKIGDDKNVWIEAEVTEDIFKQVTLGKKVSYTIDGHNLTGIVTEKIAPTPPKEPEEVAEEKPTEETEKPATEETSADKPATEEPAKDKPTEETSADKPATEEPAKDKPAEETPAEETQPVEEEAEPVEEKFIVRVSVPADRDFDLKLLSETTLKIVL